MDSTCYECDASTFKIPKSLREVQLKDGKIDSWVDRVCPSCGTKIWNLVWYEPPEVFRLRVDKLPVEE